MATTLTIKNKSGKEIKLDLGDRSPTDLAVDSVKNLIESELKSPGFAKALLDEGTISFVSPKDKAKLDNDQLKLAETILTALAKRARAQYATLKGRFEQSKAELTRLRQSYNKTWDQAKKHLDAIQAGTRGWAAFEEAVSGMVLTGETDTAVKEAEDKLEALKKSLVDLQGKKKEDISDLERWFSDRVKLEQKIENAETALATVSKEKANPLESEIREIGVTVKELRALKEKNQIGERMADLNE